MTKYILDTSVIISNPNIFDLYNNSELIIPIIVLEELDHLKHQSGDKARNARIAIKRLNELSKNADICLGIDLPTGSKLFVDGRTHKIPIGEDKTNDLRILACAKSYAKRKTSDVIVLSNDVNMRVRARAIGIKSESHDTMKTDLNELYTGMQYICNDEMLADIYEHNNVIDPNKYGITLLDNEYAVFDNSDNQNAIGKLTDDNMIRLIDLNKIQSNWIEAQNVEQFCAIDALMDTNIPLVTLIGSAGSGKTLLACGTAIDQVIDKHIYEKIIIYKPMIAVSTEIGFLPGSAKEKLDPWFGSIYDSFEFLLSSRIKEKPTKNGKREIRDLDKPAKSNWKEQLDMFEKDGKISLEAMTYIRGRNIDNAIIIMDEAQNLTQGEIKTFLTRAGKNSKIILTGDIEQIDNQRLDALNNGLTYVVEQFKGNSISAHITLKECERSVLAEVASKIL
jgi:PhoH-like ATPase